MVRSAAAALATALLASLPAQADHDPFVRSFDAVPLKPTPSLNGGIALEGADTWPAQSFRAGLLFDLSVGVLALRDGREKIGNLIPSRLDAHLMFAYAFHRRFDLAVDLPLVLHQGDNFEALLGDTLPDQGVFSLLRPCDEPFARGCGFADLRLLPRALILDPAEFPLGLAAIAEVRVPIGDGHSFTGDRAWTIAPRLTAEIGLGPLRVLANAGYRFREHGQYLNLYVGHEFAMGAGVIYRLPDLASLTEFDLLAEAHVATPTTAPFTFEFSDSLKTPLEILVGARARVANEWGVQLALGRAIAAESGYGRPDFRLMFGVTYSVRQEPRPTADVPDQDKDGVLDPEDECPREPGPRILQGCPDRDGDRVPDKTDQCPDDPGPPELDGCPDRDKDEIPDKDDKCPDQPGAVEQEGCPLSEPPTVVLEREQIKINANILFETGEARIQRQSFPILDEVARVLRENPSVGPVRIEGHTDNRGSRAFNLDLSRRRARSVLEYLVNKGVDRKRLQAAGYGFDRPIGSNATPVGRARNRRVEFRILGETEVDRGAKPIPERPKGRK